MLSCSNFTAATWVFLNGNPGSKMPKIHVPLKMLRSDHVLVPSPTLLAGPPFVEVWKVILRRGIDIVLYVKRKFRNAFVVLLK